MTEWQWNVVMALVRITLASKGYDIKSTMEQGQEDARILIEALNRKN